VDIVDYYNQYRPKNMIELNDSNVDIFGNQIKQKEEFLIGNEQDNELIDNDKADSLKPPTS